MLDTSDKVLADRLYDALQNLLPTHARFAVVWTVTDADGRMDLETAALNSLSNVSPDTLRRFAQMILSQPTDTVLMEGSLRGSS